MLVLKNKNYRNYISAWNHSSRYFLFCFFLFDGIAALWLSKDENQNGRIEIRVIEWEVWHV
jgi:hypothetical protein